MNYFQGAVHELKNVTWPTEKEVIRLTKITLSFIVLFTLLFFFTDSILSGLFTALYASL